MSLKNELSGLVLFLTLFEWSLFLESDKMCVCVYTCFSVLYLNLRFSAEDMPHLSMTKGLLISGDDGGKNPCMLEDLNNIAYTEILLPKSTQHPRFTLHNFCTWGMRRAENYLVMA